jgi:hypothetical protein
LDREDSKGGDKAVSLDAYLYATESIQERMIYGNGEDTAAKLQRMEQELEKLEKEINGDLS